MSEVIEFVDLLDKNTPTKRILRALKITHEELNHHMFFLPYYRALVEFKKEGRARLSFNNPKDAEALALVRSAHKEKLNKMYKECECELQRAKNTLG